jgi:hypothetical protein
MIAEIVIDDAQRLDGAAWQVCATVGQAGALARVPFVLDDAADGLDEAAGAAELVAAIARRYGAA